MKATKLIAERIRLFKDKHKIETPIGAIPQYFRALKIAASRSYPFDPEVKIIWFKTPKTAGSAIQSALEDAG